MSKLFVDDIVEKTSGHGVSIPGHVVQAVQFLRAGGLATSVTGVNVVLNSSSFVDVMSKAITTKFLNSQIYVALSIVAYDGTAAARASTKLLRNSTQINADEYGIYCDQSNMQPYQVFMLDEPNVAAGTVLTYKLQAARMTGSSSGLSIGYGDSGGGTSASIVLMEIAQ